jgi:hypothetical protein
MEKPVQSVKSIATKITWASMDGSQKAAFTAKVLIMVCTFGFIFGGVLVEGMTYDTYL